MRHFFPLWKQKTYYSKVLLTPLVLWQQTEGAPQELWEYLRIVKVLKPGHAEMQTQKRSLFERWNSIKIIAF